MSKKITLMTPVGVRDYNPNEMNTRNIMLNKKRDPFKGVTVLLKNNI